jgi:predicted dehydrogenase
MQVKPLNVGVIGTGMICRNYIDCLSKRFSIINLAGIADRKIEKAQALAGEYGTKAYTIDMLLEDPEIELVLNLTPPTVHFEIMKRILMAGKHAYTEKAFAMNTGEAAELMALAKEKGLYVGSAPDTFFASWVQNARQVIDSGRLGRITSFAMVGNRDNDRLLSAMAYLSKPGGGIVLDYSVYYLTVLTSLLGPIARVSANIKAPYRTHVNIFEPSGHLGETFETPNESQLYSLLELENGITGTLSINADSCFFDQTYFAIYGNKGILYLGCPDWFHGSVSLYENIADFEKSEQPTRILLDDPYAFKTDSRGVGVADFAWALRENRQPRVQASRCYHVLDVQEMMFESDRQNGCFCKVESTCERPLPLAIPTNGEESALPLDGSLLGGGGSC